MPAPPGSQRQPGIPPTVWLVQRSTTETWVGLDGTVRTRNVPIGARRFATLADHARYLAWGGPLPRSPTGADSTVQGDDGFPPGLALFRYRELVRLPTEPRALYERIHRALALAQARSQRELQQAVEDAKAQPGRTIWTVGVRDPQGAAELDAIKGLLESPVPAGVRAALYRAAALIPGVRYDGHVRDALGRAGVGVSAGRPGSEFQLIFDPATGALLGQHSPVVGDSATLAAGVVGSITTLPAGLAPIAGPRGLAPVTVRVSPAVGTPSTAFAVRLANRSATAAIASSSADPGGRPAARCCFPRRRSSRSAARAQATSSRIAWRRWRRPARPIAGARAATTCRSASREEADRRETSPRCASGCAEPPTGLSRVSAS